MARRTAGIGGSSLPSLIALGLCFALGCGEAPTGSEHCADCRFVDVTGQAGLDESSWERPQQFVSLCADPMSMGPGAAAGDFDADGWIDLFVARFDANDRLYRNLGDGTFQDVGSQAGVNSPGQSNGAAWGDLDNDGDLDLFVTAVQGPTLAYINQGDATFTEEAQARGLWLSGEDETCTALFSVSMADYDHDGDLDLVTADWGEDGFQYSRLLVNDGRGFFEDATERSGLGMSSQLLFTPVFADVDGDDWDDLLAVGDFHTSRLYLNQRDGSFTDATLDWRVGTDDSGMGAAVADINGDGWMDWFITAIAAPHDPDCVQVWGCSGNRLFLNSGNGYFEDATDEYGVRLSGWGWGTSAFDYDLDGDLDIAVASGFRSALDDAQLGPIAPALRPFISDPLTLWEHTRARPWRDVAADLGFVDSRESKALITFDYDNDGDLDVFITNTASSPTLFRNDVPEGRGWLRIRAKGKRSNMAGIGAHVYVTPREGAQPVRRDISASSTFIGQSPAEAHFGFGEEIQRVFEVRVEWPMSGRQSVLHDVQLGQTLVVDEP